MASCSKLVDPKSGPENVCRGGGDKGKEADDEGRNRRSRLMARSAAANCKRVRKIQARENYRVETFPFSKAKLNDVFYVARPHAIH